MYIIIFKYIYKKEKKQEKNSKAIMKANTTTDEVNIQKGKRVDEKRCSVISKIT